MEEDVVLLEIQDVENADFKVDVSIIKKQKKVGRFKRNYKSEGIFYK